MDRKSHFKIIGDKGNFTLINTKGKYRHHTHLKKRSTCKLLIRLVCNKTVPDSDYLRTSAMRISRDWKYIRDIEHKIEKDNDREHYVNINKGRVRFQHIP